MSSVNYKLSTGEEGRRGGPEECVWLRSGASPRFALLSSIEGSAGRSWGRYLKSYFPLSPSLTRMHDRDFCQQGQEEGSQLLPQSQSGYLGSLTILCRKKYSILSQISWQLEVQVRHTYMCYGFFFWSPLFLTLLWCPSVAAFNCSRAEQSNKAQNPGWKTVLCSWRHWRLCTQTALREPHKTRWNGKSQHRIIPTPRDLCCLKVSPS